MLLVDETVEGVTRAAGLGDDVVGVEINESPMSSEADVDELAAVVTIGRVEAVNKFLIPSGGNEEELVLDVAVERDEAGMIVSLEIVVGKSASLSLSMIAVVMKHKASPSS